MNKRILSHYILIITASILHTSAIADDKGIYAGISMGNFEAEEGGVRSSDTGLGLIVGYTFNRYIDVEASLFDIGDQEDLGMKATGISLSAQGKYTINNNWLLFGEFGGISLNAEIDEANTIMNSAGENTLSDGRDSSFFFGYGLKYKIENWNFFIKNADIDTDADFTILTLGTTYNF